MRIDPLTLAEVDRVEHPESARAVRFSTVGGVYYTFDHNLEVVRACDMATDTLLPSPADGADGLRVPDLDEGHAELVTPF